MTPAELRAAGWEPRNFEGFTGQLGEVWVRGKWPQRDVGFFVGTVQTNSHIGTVHGGALMTFADVALGYAVVDAIESQQCVTVDLQLQFVSTGKLGEFVQCRPEIVRRTSQLLFMRGLICVGERTVASASGIWKALEPRNRG